MSEEQPPKKVERVIVTVPCPPAVATAYLLLRGATLGVIGVNADEATVSLMQPTYMKEKVPSGKFSIHLGKKLGCGELQLPDNNNNNDDDDDDVDALLDAIEHAANRMISEQREIGTLELTKQEAIDKYGEGILDGSHKKTKPGDVLQIAFIEGAIVAVPPSLPYASTGSIAKITVERGCGNMASSVMCGKKARKAEVTIKFCVEDKTNGGGTVSTPVKEEEGGGVDVVAIMNDDLKIAKVRMPEGLALLEKQKKEQAQQQQEVEAAAAVVTQDTMADDDAVKNDVAETDEETMIVTAWEVQGKIDYNKLVDNFGSKLIDQDLLDRLQACIAVPKLHRFLRRNVFFSHRDLHGLLDCVEKGIPIYLYTGRGPSSGSMHLGHLIPFLFTKWLQDAFDCPLVIQMTDDEKFLFKGEYDEQKGDNLNYFANLTIENARDIIACGFEFKKTFIFSDLDYVGRMYPNIVRIWKAVTTNSVNGIFGFDGSSNIGKVAFPGVQAAPSFASSFPTVLNATRESDIACLIPCAIDQDPYFRMTRDVAHKLVAKSHELGGKPALIHAKFFPPLQGAKGKMSSSDKNSAVFLTDTPEEIEQKIKEFAFSGGQETKALQQEKGADLEADVAYQWLRFFLEDDEELERIGKDYSTGSGEYWSTGKVKQRLVGVLQDLVREHQGRRAKITDDEVRKWMTERCIL